MVDKLPTSAPSWLQWVNNILTFWVALMLGMGLYLLLLWLPGYHDIQGIFAIALMIGMLIVGLGFATIVTRWQRGKMISKGIVPHLILLLVLILLVVVTLPQSFTYVTY